MAKKNKMVFETSQNFIYTILDNFNDKYKKRILRYYIRSLRKLRRELR